MSTLDHRRSSVSELESFIALNGEIASLIRIGLPLEVGLRSSNHKGLQQITQRLKNGESLQSALNESSANLPPAYRAVVEAGLASGRLGESVQTVSRAAQAMATLRRRLSLASIYPSIILVLAFAFLALILPYLLDPLSQLIDSGRGHSSSQFRSFLRLFTENPTGWLYWLPILCIALLWASGGLAALALRLPGLGRVLRFYRISTFADLTAGLVTGDIPLERSIVLAAEASGDKRLTRDAAKVMERLRAGEPPVAALKSLVSLPSFARWMILAGAAQGTLPATLRNVATWASRRAAAGLDWFSLLAPAALIVLVGGFAVAVCIALSLGPVILLLYDLARAISR